MTDLTDRERKVLLETAKVIHAYKIMQAKGYERLIKKVKDERTGQLLAERLAPKSSVTLNPGHKKSSNWQARTGNPTESFFKSKSQPDDGHSGY